MSEKKLKSLEEHNKITKALRDYNRRRQWNGIACPDCGAELYDEEKPYGEQNLMLRMYPEVNIRCEKCKYGGTRLV